MKLWFSTLKLKKVAAVLLFSCVALAGCGSNHSNASHSAEKDEKTEMKDDFAKLEEQFDAKLGIFALDTGTNRTVTYRPDEKGRGKALIEKGS